MMKLAKLTIGVLSASLLLSACGGGNDSPNPSPNPTPSPTPDVTVTPTPTANCDTTLPSFVSCIEGDPAVYTISGIVDADYTMDADWEWRLDGVVTVGAGNVNVASDADVTAIQDAGVTLTVEAGADIKALDDGILLVTRGSKLMADGTALAPITFSSLDDGYDGEGEWGGIVVQGFAPQYGAGNTGACFGTGTVCNVEGEGGTAIAVYGGNIEDDDSGIIRYVRIAEGGLVAGPNNEVNGLTFQGVGHSTTVEYVHVHNNLDDGLEWFGGTVNVKYVVLTNNDDDDIDFDEGYKGNIQYALVVKNQTKTEPTGSNDPRGIEANSSDDEYVPQTEAVLSNVTVIGGPVNNNADHSSGQQPGMRLRGSVNIDIHNTAVRGFDTGCIRIDDSDTDGDDTADSFSDVTLNNVFGDCTDGLYDRRDADTVSNAILSSVTIDDAYALTEDGATLSAPVAITAVDNGSGFVFDATDYIGAVEPGTLAATAWWADWTLPGVLSGVDPNLPPAEADFVSCDATALVCTISGTVDEDYTMVASYEWRLDGVVTVGAGNVTVATDADVTAIIDAGVTLTIQPGTDVKAFDDGILLVTRGSRLSAAGTAAAPITFSSLDDGYDGEGEWGGVVIQGFAPQYGAGNTGACFGSGTVCNVEGEGGTAIAVYGGNRPEDDSGIIRYVRIAEGGLVAGPNNEVNGLTFQGVGYGTTVEYVHVHNNLDDGLEWFGGTVNAKYVVLTNNDDDDIDFDEGYQGNIQYGIIVKNQTKTEPTGSNDPRGIEANSSDDEYVPQTEAVLANIIVIGGPVNNNGAHSSGQQPGMRLRGSVNVDIHNTAVRGFDTGCIRIDDSDIDGDDTIDSNSDVTLNNVFGNCTDGFYDRRDADTENNAISSTVTLDDAFALTEAGADLGTATTITAMNNGSGFTFDQTDYIGAVAPGTPEESAWWSGWIIDGALDDVEALTPPATADFVSCDDVTLVCTISGNVNEDYTMVAGYEWRIDGVVTVGAGNVTVADDTDVAAIQDAGVTLTVEAGTDVKAFDDGILLVTRGSRLVANGTANAPITFSSLDDGYDGEGEWGGVVIQGFAPQYGAGNTGACYGSGTVCNVEGEGGTAIAVYGGNMPEDDSGVIRYVRIAEGGLVAGPNNEVNGLTMQGVGYGTTVEYVQVHNNLDDGLEWFGGTVNAKYVVLTNNDDDDIDFDEGYQGNIQYAIVVKNQNKTEPTGSNDPRGIEANSSDDEFVPQTNAVLANITVIGGPVNNNAAHSSGQQPGMRLRGSLTVAIHNTAVTGFDTGCIRIDDSDTDGDDAIDSVSNVTLNNVFGECVDGFYDRRDADSETNSMASDVTLDEAFALTEAAAQLGATATITAMDNGSGFAFDQTDFVGAVAPGETAASAWWASWVIDGSLDDAIANNDQQSVRVSLYTRLSVDTLVVKKAAYFAAFFVEARSIL